MAEDVRHGEKDPDHTEEDGLNETKYPNCQEKHPYISRYFDIYEREGMLEVKYKRNVTFLS